MSDARSLLIILDFKRRIANLQTTPGDQKFIRELLAEIAADCPLNVLEELANCLLRIREREMKAETDGN